MTGGIDRGRDAFDRQAWGRAYDQLSAAGREEPLEVEDLERLAAAAYLIGHSEESSDIWTRAHQECAATRRRGTSSTLRLLARIRPVEQW